MRFNQGLGGILGWSSDRGHSLAEERNCREQCCVVICQVQSSGCEEMKNKQGFFFSKDGKIVHVCVHRVGNAIERLIRGISNSRH